MNKAKFNSYNDVVEMPGIQFRFYILYTFT